MEETKAATVIEFLRELSAHVKEPTQLVIGGSIALIIPSWLSRHTEDIDVVDEVPIQLRSQNVLLDALAARYGLRLTQFQSHYLPSGWQSRLRPFERFGELQVLLVDEYDIMLSKLFSKREKDRDDLRMLSKRLDKPTFAARLATSGQSLSSEPSLRSLAEQNWFVIYGESLPA